MAARVAAISGAAFAFVVIVGRFNVETLSHYIAGGPLGNAAFATGAQGIATATLGLASPATLAVMLIVFYALIISPWAHTLANAYVLGVAYGAGTWVFMNGAMLPLGRAARKPVRSGSYLAFGMDCALLVDLPIELIFCASARRAGERVDRTA